MQSYICLLYTSQVKECKEQRYNILATGEMGIGNTTTSTALACILLNLEPHMATGRGAGLDDKGLKKKIEVITRAKEMYGSCQDNPLTLLQNIGGLDIACLLYTSDILLLHYHKTSCQDYLCSYLTHANET